MIAVAIMILAWHFTHNVWLVLLALVALMGCSDDGADLPGD